MTTHLLRSTSCADAAGNPKLLPLLLPPLATVTMKTEPAEWLEGSAASPVPVWGSRKNSLNPQTDNQVIKH